MTDRCQQRRSRGRAQGGGRGGGRAILAPAPAPREWLSEGQEVEIVRIAQDQDILTPTVLQRCSQGFSPRSLKYMRAPAEAWPEESSVPEKMGGSGVIF